MAHRKNPSTGSATPADKTDSVRLQKFLAQAGVGSRRQCEDLIREGRVAIDGHPATELGVRIDPQQQTVEVDGTRVRAVRHQYFMVNKPPGVVSTTADPSGRLRVIDLINTDQRVYNVGRLDKSSEGLILVTNDGELANRLTHPRYGIQKTYLVTVVGNPRWEELQLLKQGVRLAEGVARVTEIRIKKRHRKNCDLQIVLDEGRNREIRRLLARIGHKVTRLKRVAIGPLHLNDLPVGSWRRLEAAEITALQRASARIREPQSPQKKPMERGELEQRQRTKSRTGAAGAARKKVSGAKAASRPQATGKPGRDKPVRRSGADKGHAPGKRTKSGKKSAPGKKRAAAGSRRSGKPAAAPPVTGTRNRQTGARKKRPGKKPPVSRARKTTRQSGGSGKR